MVRENNSSLEIKDKRTKDWFWDYREIFTSDLSAYARLVRLCLSMHADYNNRTAHPSLNLIAAECGISRSSVVRSLKELEDKGWITRSQRQLPTSNYTSTLYEVLTPPEREQTKVNEQRDGVGSQRHYPYQADSEQTSGVVSQGHYLCPTEPGSIRQILGSSQGETGVVSQADSNKNHRTRIIEQEIQSVSQETVHIKKQQSKVDADQLTGRLPASSEHEIAATFEGQYDARDEDLQTNELNPIFSEAANKLTDNPDQQVFSSILKNAELNLFPEDSRKLLQGILEDMYYGQKFAEKTGLPRTIVQKRLQLVTPEVLTYAIGKVKHVVDQGMEITNSGAYLSMVIFNAITEVESDLIAKKPMGNGGDKGDSPGNSRKHNEDLKKLYCN